MSKCFTANRWLFCVLMVIVLTACASSSQPAPITPPTSTPRPPAPTPAIPAIAPSPTLTRPTIQPTLQPTARPTAQRSVTTDLRTYWSHNTCAGQGPVRFKVSPLKLEDIGHILPLGLMIGGHVTPIDHQYYTPKDLKAGRFRYDVRAMADGYIVHIQRRTAQVEPNLPPADEYRMAIEHSCTFWTYFDLITQLDQTILDQLGGAPQDQRPLLTRIPVKAGQVVGKVGAQTLDLGAVNSETTLKGLLVPAHYDAEPWKIHTVDPFDYYDEPLRSQLLALNPRKATPYGGKIDYDVDGKLVGNWFKVGTNGYAGVRGTGQSSSWIGHLTIAYYYLDPQYVVVSLGDFGGQARQFWAKGNTPDPASIGETNGVVKYELIMGQLANDGKPITHPDKDKVQGTLLAQVLPNRQLRVEVFVGKTGAEATGFTSAALLYER